MEKDFADTLEQLEYNASYAKSLAKIGKYERAFKIMDRAIRKDSKDYNNWYVAGWIAHKAKVYGQALKLLDIAIDLNLESVVVMVELSEVHEKLGNMTEAKYCISEAYKRDTYWWKIHDRNFLLNSVKNGSNTEKTLSLQEHHDLGEEKLSYYNYPDALRHFLKTVDDDRYVLDWYHLAECMERLKMLDRFIEIFSEDRLEKFPMPFMWCALGDIYYYKHNEEKAMECYHKELKNMENNFADKLEQLEYNAAYAKTLGKIGEYGRAIEIIEKAIRKEPYKWDNLYVGGWISNQAELYEQALLFLDTCYELNRECPVTMVELSEVHEKLGNMFLAKDYMLQAFQIDFFWWKTRDGNFILNFELY